MKAGIRRVVEVLGTVVEYAGPPKAWREAERELRARDRGMKVSLPRVSIQEVRDEA